MCFLVNFEKFLRKPFFQNTSGRLLLYLKHFEVKAEEVLADNEMYYVQSQVTESEKANFSKMKPSRNIFSKDN